MDRYLRACVILIAICCIVEIVVLFTILLQLTWWRTIGLSQTQVQSMVLETHAATYKAYLDMFGKKYESNEVLKRRFQFFKHSLKEIERLNRTSGVRYDLIKLSDVPHEELFNHNDRSGVFLNEACRMRNGTCRRSNSSIDFYDKWVPIKFDWRDHGAVGPVQNQKKCNGCWAFGIMGAMESRAAIRSKHLPSLSTQELIDCSANTNGCNFGHVAKALEWLCNKQWGIVSEEEYPLKLFKQKCGIKGPPPGYKVEKYWYLCSMNGREDEILRLLAHHGPVIVVVNALSWINYIDGVIRRDCFHESLNHVVQIVGYDQTADIPHYIVRNSWGDDFGDGGYVKLAIGSNVCGVADEVSALEVYY